MLSYTYRRWTRYNAKYLDQDDQISMLRTFSPDNRIALTLFVLVSSIYFATIVGVTSSNDGSHYALVRAIVERRSFEISPYLDFTEHQDYAFRGDLRFSDRPPGTAIAAAPLYAASWFLPEPNTSLPSKHDAQNNRLIYAVLLSPLGGAGAVSLFYLTLRNHLGRSQFAAFMASIALAFGTTTWKYGSVLYSHALSALVAWGALYLVLRSWRKPPGIFGSGFLGFLLGYAPLIEYTNVPFSAIVGIAWLLGLGPLTRRLSSASQKSLLALVLGGLIPIGFLLAYNTMNFGGPFELSTFNVDTSRWPQNEGLAADFATPLLVGLKGMLFYGSGNQGLFLLAPVSIISLLGLLYFIRFSPRPAALLLGIFVMMLLIFAKSTTFNAATNDGRYLTPFIGLWLVPLAFWLDAGNLPQRGDVRMLLTGLLLFGLLFLSIRNQMTHIAFSWNYDLDLTLLRRMAVAPDNIAYFLSTLFPNTANLPILWLGELIAFGLIGLLMRWSKSRPANSHVTYPMPELNGEAT